MEETQQLVAHHVRIDLNASWLLIYIIPGQTVDAELDILWDHLHPICTYKTERRQN